MQRKKKKRNPSSSVSYQSVPFHNTDGPGKTYTQYCTLPYQWKDLAGYLANGDFGTVLQGRVSSNLHCIKCQLIDSLVPPDQECAKVQVLPPAGKIVFIRCAYISASLVESTGSQYCIICISASTAHNELTDSTVFVPASLKTPASVGPAGNAAPKAGLGQYAFGTNQIKF